MDNQVDAAALLNHMIGESETCPKVRIVHISRLNSVDRCITPDGYTGYKQNDTVLKNTIEVFLPMKVDPTGTEILGEQYRYEIQDLS